MLFATDSPLIKARWVTSEKNASENMTAIAQKGLDLYIKKDGEWVFAGVGRPEMADGPAYDRHEGTIVKSMLQDFPHSAGKALPAPKHPPHLLFCRRSRKNK